MESSTMNAFGMQESVSIAVDGCFATIEGGADLGLRDLLSCSTYTFEMGDEGFRRVQIDRVFYRTAGNDLRICVGFVPRVIEHLEALGREIELIPDVGSQNHEWLLPASQHTVGSEQELIEFLRPAQCAQLRVGPQGDEFLCKLVSWFPKANVVVVSPNNARADRLARKLETPDRPALRIPKVDGGRRGQLYVCMVQSFPLCNPDLWDVAVFDGARPALCKQTYEHAKWMMKSARIYCVHDLEDLKPHEQMRLESLCSAPTWLYSASQEPREVWVSLIEGAPSAPLGRLGGVSRSASEIPRELHRKRVQVWHNADRNKLIAQVAHAALQGDLDQMQQWNAPPQFDHQALYTGRQLTTAILVESPEHGRVLKELLPGLGADYDQVPSEPR